MPKITMTGHAKLKIQWAHCSLWLWRWVIQSENPRGTRHSKPFRPFQLVVHWRGCHSAAQWLPCERGLSLASENGWRLGCGTQRYVVRCGVQCAKSYWLVLAHWKSASTPNVSHFDLLGGIEKLRNLKLRILDAFLVCVCVLFDGIRQGITQK